MKIELTSCDVAKIAFHLRLQIRLVEEFGDVLNLPKSLLERARDAESIVIRKMVNLEGAE